MIQLHIAWTVCVLMMCKEKRTVHLGMKMTTTKDLLKSTFLNMLVPIADFLTKRVLLSASNRASGSAMVGETRRLHISFSTLFGLETGMYHFIQTLHLERLSLNAITAEVEMSS